MGEECFRDAMVEWAMVVCAEEWQPEPNFLPPSVADDGCSARWDGVFRPTQPRRHGASAPDTGLGSPSASAIYSVSYARPTTTPRAHPATSVGTRELVRRLDEERFARKIEKLKSPTADAGSPRTVAPHPSPRLDNPYRSSPRTHSDRLFDRLSPCRAV